MDKQSIIREIASAFSLPDEAAQTACLLLEARAKTLDYTFEEYVKRYHPAGIAGRDETLPSEFKGYVQFLGDDAAAVLRTGKGADFSTFVHECAHVFRRQLAGELQVQAEKVFGVSGGVWSTEKEERFARGLEQWVKRRHSRDKTRAAVYNKGKAFVGTVYRGMERIIDIDPRMEAVYERLFEDNTYAFKQTEYEKTLHEAAQGKFPGTPHVYLGMTPRMYEELGFQRLPMAITAKHLYSTLRAEGELQTFHYHNLGEDLLRQIPEQLKKPLLIVQHPDNEADIISIISLKDKEGNTIIVPIAQFQKGNVTGAEIDINLVKTVFGKKGFEDWLTAAIDDGRLLYADKKRTGPALAGKLTPRPEGQGTVNPVHTVQARSTLPPGRLRSDVLQDVSGFIPENIARYREAVKRKFPERFIQGDRILYQKNESAGQLAFDFQESPKNVPPDFKLGYGEAGNGVTVWNRKKEIRGDYETVAVIETDGTVRYRTAELPSAVKAEIENAAKTFYPQKTAEPRPAQGQLDRPAVTDKIRSVYQPQRRELHRRR